MKKLRNVKPYVVLICAGILLYAFVGTFSTARAIKSGSVDINNLFNLKNAENVFEEFGQHGKTIYKLVDIYYSRTVSGEIPSNQVIFGKDNWLFYKGEESINDYEGTNSYSDGEMQQMLNSVLKVQNTLAEHGIQFALLVPPNKERVYYEYMPKNYKHAEQSRTDKLLKYLYENGVNVISSKSELIEAKKDYQVYYSYDTHWNQLGAYIGTRRVLSSWGIDIPELKDRNIARQPLSECDNKSAGDDLAGMIGMRKKYCDEIEYSIEGNAHVDFDNLNCTETQNAKRDEVLLLIGDSFRVAMAPTLAAEFKTVYIVHINDYSPDMLETIQPDYVIAEYVERYSSAIKNIESIIE